MKMIVMIYEANVSDPTDLSRGGDSFVGKLRSNMLGTQVMMMVMMMMRRIKTMMTVMMIVSMLLMMVMVRSSAHR